MQYFVCSEGFIWTIREDGFTNYPANYNIEGDTVVCIGKNEGGKTEQTPEGKYVGEVLGEYNLWNSLTELAAAIEPQPAMAP